MRQPSRSTSAHGLVPFLSEQECTVLLYLYGVIGWRRSGSMVERRMLGRG